MRKTSYENLFRFFFVDFDVGVCFRESVFALDLDISCTHLFSAQVQFFVEEVVSVTIVDIRDKPKSTRLVYMIGNYE